MIDDWGAATSTSQPNEIYCHADPNSNCNFDKEAAHDRLTELLLDCSDTDSCADDIDNQSINDKPVFIIGLENDYSKSSKFKKTELLNNTGNNAFGDLTRCKAKIWNDLDFV